MLAAVTPLNLCWSIMLVCFPMSTAEVFHA